MALSSLLNPWGTLKSGKDFFAGRDNFSSIQEIDPKFRDYFTQADDSGRFTLTGKAAGQMFDPTGQTYSRESDLTGDPSRALDARDFYGKENLYNQFAPEYAAKSFKDPMGATWFPDSLYNNAGYKGVADEQRKLHPGGGILNYIDDNPWTLIAAGLAAGVAFPAAAAAGGAAGGGALAGGLAEGGALASEAGFLPGSFELGASGYGGSAAAGLDAAAGAAGGASGTLAGAADVPWGVNPINGGLTPVDMGLEVNPFSTDPSLADLGGNWGDQSWMDQLTQLYNDSLGKLPPGSTTAAQQLAQTGADAEDAAQGTAMTNALNQGGGPGINQPLSTQNWDLLKGAPPNLISQLLGVDEATAKLIGSLGSAALGILGSSQQAGSLSGLAAQARADRLPALNALNGAIANPASWYQSAPAQGAAEAVLSKLSMGGNPANNPGALAKAAAYNLGGYNDYIKSMTSPAFGTANIDFNLGSQASTASNGIYNSLGYGLAGLTQPENSLSSLAKQLQDLKFIIGGS